MQQQPKRARVSWQSAGVPNLRVRSNRDGSLSFAHYWTDTATGKQHQRTLSATKLGDAKREQRVLAVDVDKGRAVRPSRITVEQAADELIASIAAQVSSGQKAERTLEAMEYRLARVKRLLGRREVQKINADTVSSLSGDLGVPGYTALRRLLSFCVRRGYVLENPCSKLERGERPTRARREICVLDHLALRKLLDGSRGSWRVLIALVAFSGLRQMEALALRWQDVDLENGYLRVRHQLSRARAEKPARLVPLKTGAALRDVVMTPQLATLLREYRLAQLSAGLHGPGRFVFCTSHGTPINHRNATRAINAAAKRGGVTAVGFHLLRHGFASYLIVDLGLDVVQVSRQLGHARPSITLDTYSHLFDQARHAEDIRSRMASSAFGRVLEART